MYVFLFSKGEKMDYIKQIELILLEMRAEYGFFGDKGERYAKNRALKRIIALCFNACNEIIGGDRRF